MDESKDPVPSFTIDYTHQYRCVGERTWYPLCDQDDFPVDYLKRNAAIVTANETVGSKQPTHKFSPVVDTRVRDLTGGKDEVIWTSWEKARGAGLASR